MTRLKNLWQKKRLRVFVREVFNGAIVAFGAWLASLSTEQSVMLVAFLTPVLSNITKRINTKYFGDLGVANQDGTVTLAEEISTPDQIQ